LPLAFPLPLPLPLVEVMIGRLFFDESDYNRGEGWADAAAVGVIAVYRGSKESAAPQRNLTDSVFRRPNLRQVFCIIRSLETALPSLTLFSGGNHGAIRHVRRLSFY
jgi:hypothetical protein